MWSVYAASGYARHLYYLSPAQLSHALELNTISRSLCMLSIAIGKISVAFMIERIARPGDWRKWLLRGISISVLISAVITFTLFYAQCQPARAVWDKGMIKQGTASCWNPISVNTWDLVIASKLFALSHNGLLLMWRHRRLLGVLRFCSRRYPCGHSVEATVEHAKEAATDTASGHGCFVSPLSVAVNLL